MAEAQNQTFIEKLPSIAANALLKAVCFDGIMNFGARSDYQLGKIALATGIYFVRDVSRELLPENLKFLAIGSGLLAGGLKGYVNGYYLGNDATKFVTTAFNNAAYETSKYFANSTFDDWYTGPIIESAESLYSLKPTDRVYGKIHEAVYRTVMETVAATKIFVSASPYVDSVVKSLQSTVDSYICFPKEGEGYECAELLGESIVPYALDEGFLICKGSVCSPLINNSLVDNSEL